MFAFDKKKGTGMNVIGIFDFSINPSGRLFGNQQILDFDIYTDFEFSSKSDIATYPCEIYMKPGSVKNFGNMQISEVYDYKWNTLSTFSITGISEMTQVSDVLKSAFYNWNINGRIDTILKELIKYKLEKHRLTIITEVNTFEYYDLVNYHIKQDESNLGLFEVRLDFVQNFDAYKEKDVSMEKTKKGKEDNYKQKTSRKATEPEKDTTDYRLDRKDLTNRH